MTQSKRWGRFLLLQSALVCGFAGTAGAVTPTGVTKVSRVTGATPAGEVLPNPNQTHTNYEVYGTDLGIVWDKGGGEVFVLFGDTFGIGWCGNGGCGGGWRSNVLARSSDTSLSNGLTFSTMIQDSARHAKEILPSRKINNDEITVIPTAGVTVGSRHYIHYMSVNHWGEPGMWFTNYAGIAYSKFCGFAIVIAPAGCGAALALVSRYTEACAPASAPLRLIPAVSAPAVLLMATSVITLGLVESTLA